MQGKSVQGKSVQGTSVQGNQCRENEHRGSGKIRAGLGHEGSAEQGLKEYRSGSLLLKSTGDKHHKSSEPGERWFKQAGAESTHCFGGKGRKGRDVYDMQRAE